MSRKVGGGGSWAYILLAYALADSGERLTTGQPGKFM